MADDEKDEAAADEAGAGEGEVEKEGGDEAASEDKGEDARRQPAGKKEVLRDPRTGDPLRDQTPAAKDTGYLGNHDMQDQTEASAGPESPSEEDFGNDGE